MTGETNVNLQVFSDNEWLYPDSELTVSSETVRLDSARGAHDSFQVLTDLVLSEPARADIHWCFDCGGGLSITAYQLMPAHVEENSGAQLYTTLDYESVRSFVTRRAPFDVFDITREIDDDWLTAGRVAFFFRVNVAPEAKPGRYSGTLSIAINQDKAELSLDLFVYRAVVPVLAKATFGMINWLKLEPLATSHGLTEGSKAFWQMVQRYLDHQLDMRNTHLQLPTGVPVRAADGSVVDFDFTAATTLGNMALAAGFNFIYGGFVARFQQWDQPEHYLLWDRDVSVASFEGYRQLRLYFSKLRRQVLENNWGDRYWQGLVDEPQFPNSEHYRILSSICRKFLPGITIIDPVETTQIGGALEIWVVKQSVYEAYQEEYDRLAALGEELWVYTCGFPAGSVMNRSTDLPPLAGRLPMWMSYAYGLKGFLHWGYNAYNRDPFQYNCWDASHDGVKRLLPPGDGFIVYPGQNGPMDSIRSHLQRAGCEEAELLYQLDRYDRAKAKAIVAKVCRSFEDYETLPGPFAVVRRDLLAALEPFMEKRR